MDCLYGFFFSPPFSFSRGKKIEKRGTISRAVEICNPVRMKRLENFAVRCQERALRNT